MFNMVASVKNLTAAVAALNKEFSGVAKTIKSISTTGPAAMKSLQGIAKLGGTLKLGSSDPIMTNSASFTDTTPDVAGVKSAQSSSATQRQNSSTTTMPWMYTARGAGALAAVKGVTGLLGAGYAGLPDLGATVGRAAGFYGAATMGGMNQRVLRQATFSGLAGGITGIGDDAIAAATLVQGYRYSPNSAAFNMRVREVGGAARYLNISNPVAAQALGQLGTGSMAGNLSQYGIFTTDPKTGKDLSFEQIARQVYNRAYGGRKGVTREQVMTDVRKGFLGADLNYLGFDQTQQELFVNAFGNFAEGKGFNLETMKGTANPLNAAMRMTTSQTSLMERGTEPMIRGFEQAATVVENFNKAMEGLPDLMFQFKGIIQGITGSNLGAPLGILAGTGSSVVSGLTGAAAMRALMGGGGGGGAALKTAGKVASKVVPGVGAVVSGAGGYVDAKTGGGLNTGGLLSAIGTGAAAGGIAGGIASGGVFALPGALLGGTVSGLGYLGGYLLGGRGGGTTGFGASFGAKGGGPAQSPVPGVAPTSGFGAKDNSGIWSGSNNTHTGQDYPMPVGSEVKAAMDGVVFDDAPGFEYGITVQIDHENGFQTLYGHLNKALVKPGERVKKGQVIGKSGDTGNVTGPHLHFEVRKGSNNPVDPSELLSAPFENATSLLEYASNSTNTVSETTSTSSSSYSSGIKPSANKQEWIKNFLTSINAPHTKDNIYAMSEWIRFESGDKWNRWNNPLNTTLNRPGARSMNSVGVKMYGSSEEGLSATLATLTGNRADQRGYTKVLEGLRSGASYQESFNNIRASAWVGGEEKKSPYQFNYSRGPKGGGTTGFGASFQQAEHQPKTVVGNTVNIYVSVQSASEEEMVRFAKGVKRYLENGKSLTTMGSK